jgi:hypothetical protein
MTREAFGEFAPVELAAGELVDVLISADTDIGLIPFVASGAVCWVERSEDPYAAPCEVVAFPAGAFGLMVDMAQMTGAGIGSGIVVLRVSEHECAWVRMLHGC